jgi:hypothetical protein
MYLSTFSKGRTTATMEMALVCRALYVSDRSPVGKLRHPSTGYSAGITPDNVKGCTEATRLGMHVSTLFVANPPTYIAKRSTPLANQIFDDVEEETTLNEIHDHLFLRFQLLDRVIRARKLHHSRFFSQDMDYGHENYLYQLQSQRCVVLKALERLERRTAEIVHKKQ